MQRNYWNPWERSSREEVISEYSRHPLEMWDSPDRASDDFAIGQAEALIKIERLVNYLASTSGPAYLMRRNQYGGWTPLQTPIGRRLLELVPYLRMYDSWHQYSEGPLAFLDAGWIISSTYGLDLANIHIASFHAPMLIAESMNAMVDKIRMNSREIWFRRARSDRRYEAGYRASAIAKYANEILRYYARTMIVRVDGSYRKDARATLTIDQVYSHIDYLIYLKEWHPAFSGLVGYVIEVEQGERDGFHAHMAFLYDGSKVCRDIHKGFEICDLWRYDITHGMGTAENCNAKKERYRDKVGIGMIHRTSPIDCANAIRCLQYLAKGGEFIDRDNQFLRIKPKDRHVLFTGYAPDIEEKRGRPAAAF